MLFLYSISNCDKEITTYSFIKSIKLSIATFPSLFYQTLITDNLTIEGLSIIIEQEQSGKFILSNISNKTQSETDINPNFASAIQDWLQHQQNLTLFNTYITIGLRTEDQYPITLDEIHFEKGKDLGKLDFLRTNLITSITDCTTPYS